MNIGHQMSSAGAQGRRSRNSGGKLFNMSRTSPWGSPRNYTNSRSITVGMGTMTSNASSWMGHNHPVNKTDSSNTNVKKESGNLQSSQPDCPWCWGPVKPWPSKRKQKLVKQQKLKQKQQWRQSRWNWTQSDWCGGYDGDNDIDINVEDAVEGWNTTHDKQSNRRNDNNEDAQLNVRVDDLGLGSGSASESETHHTQQQEQTQEQYNDSNTIIDDPDQPDPEYEAYMKTYYDELYLYQQNQPTTNDEVMRDCSFNCCCWLIILCIIGVIVLIVSVCAITVCRVQCCGINPTDIIIDPFVSESWQYKIDGQKNPDVNDSGYLVDSMAILSLDWLQTFETCDNWSYLLLQNTVGNFLKYEVLYGLIWDHLDTQWEKRWFLEVFLSQDKSVIESVLDFWTVFKQVQLMDQMLGERDWWKGTGTKDGIKKDATTDIKNQNNIPPAGAGDEHETVTPGTNTININGGNNNEFLQKGNKSGWDIAKKSSEKQTSKASAEASHHTGKKNNQYMKLLQQVNKLKTVGGKVNSWQSNPSSQQQADPPENSKQQSAATLTPATSKIIAAKSKMQQLIKAKASTSTSNIDKNEAQAKQDSQTQKDLNNDKNDQKSNSPGNTNTNTSQDQKNKNNESSSNNSSNSSQNSDSSGSQSQSQSQNKPSKFMTQYQSRIDDVNFYTLTCGPRGVLVSFYKNTGNYKFVEVLQEYFKTLKILVPGGKEMEKERPELGGLELRGSQVVWNGEVEKTGVQLKVFDG